jgi:hypothetical protein
MRYNFDGAGSLGKVKKEIEKDVLYKYRYKFSLQVRITVKYFLDNKRAKEKRGFLLCNKSD